MIIFIFIFFPRKIRSPFNSRGVLSLARKHSFAKGIGFSSLFMGWLNLGPERLGKNPVSGTANLGVSPATSRRFLGLGLKLKCLEKTRRHDDPLPKFWWFIPYRKVKLPKMPRIPKSFPSLPTFIAPFNQSIKSAGFFQIAHPPWIELRESPWANLHFVCRVPSAAWYSLQCAEAEMNYSLMSTKLVCYLALENLHWTVETG